MKRLILGAAVAALFFTACKSDSALVTPNPITSIRTAKPALWKISDADTTIYLFGTIHVLPKALKWRTPRMEKALGSASELVLEVADTGDDAKTAGIFFRLATSPNLPPLSERVPSEKRAGLSALIARTGLPAPFLDKMESWAAAVTLSAGMLGELGLKPEDGAENQLTATFKAAHKPISGLETTEQQLGFFDTLPEASQRTFLVSMVDDATDPKTEFANMLRSWAKGDLAAIAVSFDDELQLSPDLVDVLIRKRNAAWTQWLANRIGKPGTIFVAVGAGHLAGRDSVQTMLAARGIKSQRLQ